MPHRHTGLSSARPTSSRKSRARVTRPPGPAPDALVARSNRAYANAHAALERFKARHPDAEGETAIPLVRLGTDASGEKRTISVTAKRLLGSSEDRIRRRVEESGGPLIEEEAL